MQEKIIREIYDKNLNEKIRLKRTDKGNIIFTTVKMGERMKEIKCMQKPMFAHIRLTSKCNLKCPYCYTDDNRLTKDMSFDEVKQVIDLCNKNGIMNITWTGGEPLLRKNFDELIRKTNSYGINQTILTIGLSLNNLFNIPNENITFQISLNNVWEQSQDIEIIIQNAKKMVEKKFTVIMSVMLKDVKICFIQELLDKLVENHIPGIRFGLEIPVGGLKEKNMAAYENNIIDMAGELFELRKQYENKIKIFYQFDKSQYIDTGFPRRFFMCEAGTTQIYIDNNGDVYPCPLFKSYKEFYCGNVFNDSWEELWNSPPMMEFRSVEECANCEYNCSVWCRAFVYGKDKSLNAFSPFCLKQIKN